MRPVPSFLTAGPLAAARSPPRRTRPHACPAVCTHHPHGTPTPDGSPIPHGARLIPPSSDTALDRRLSNLRFGYEGPAPAPAAACAASAVCAPAAAGPCTLRYRCAHGHIVSGRAGSPACKVCPTCAFEMGTPCVRASPREDEYMRLGARRGRARGAPRLTLCQVAALASVKGGVLLSNEYRNARSPLLWKCKEGHVWRASVSNVRSAQSWCPECARQKKKLTMHDMHVLARDRGGLCLSDEYISEHGKLKWRCAQGHEFWMAPNNIRRREGLSRKPSWCKICRTRSPNSATLKKSKLQAAASG